ncbi:sensor histidine kinase [Microcella frigidaquae]|uniref:Oxygen sensor histidine kinase NreB n=1 Tax=Microcella frigidaquae TaxID=424758 RepID=A0A840XP08_9MICO|nr:sensor histidine kinase [Microcella frigidaquae]MBB5618328.1 signal transduction histidine kinase [Microcella frigidaquae]NHN44766.1 sensor histidine kinase [Microcella frigidaquae]
MTARRWWWVAVLGMAALAGALAVLSLQTPWRLALALTGIGMLIASWALWGDRRVMAGETSVAVILGVALAAGTATAGFASLAILQAIAYPIAWVFSSRLRDALLANLAVALAVGVGFAASIGTEPDDLRQIVFTQSLALGFSLAMGFWISRMTELGEERGRLLVELQGAQEQIAALNREAGAAAEGERLARELHDTIAQDLTGLVMLAQRARREAAAPDGTLAMIEEGARAALGETRALVAAGAALDTDGLGLDGALQRLAERFERETGVAVSLAIDEGVALSRDAEVVVLRCAQEALSNARKHARARQVVLDVGIAEGGPERRIRLTVSDDGIGFDPDSAPAGFGLSGMNERLALVGGTLRATSAPGAGTVIVAELPASIPNPTGASTMEAPR